MIAKLTANLILLTTTVNIDLLSGYVKAVMGCICLMKQKTWFVYGYSITYSAHTHHTG